MSRKLKLSDLLVKKVFENLHLKIFTIINAALVISLGLVVISMGINFNKYKKYKLEENDYFRQITYINDGEQDVFNTLINNLENEDYLNYRYITKTPISVTQIEDTNIEMLNIRFAHFKSSNHLFLSPSEVNSGFNIIGDNILNNGEVLITYKYAILISIVLDKSFDDLLGKSVTINDNGINKNLKIVGIIDEKTSLNMEYLGDNGIFRYSDITDNNIVYATYEYEDILQLEYIRSKYNSNVTTYHYIESLKSIINQTTIFTLIFVLLGILTLIVSNGIIISSVNMEFISQLPFMSVLKIIGIKNKSIAMFTYYQSIALMILGFTLAFPISILLNYIINLFVNVDVLFNDIDFKIVNLNYFAFILCFVILLLLNLITFFIQLHKIRSLNVNNTFLYELEK